jgi:UDPglucose--hexose-1-phosphate uridylyltransferase
MNFDRPHRRQNLLTGEWVLVSPHRAKRPWQGQVEKTPVEKLPAYDPTCYLCPGNKRSVGIQNPPYTGTFVFGNDFSSLLPPENGEGFGVEHNGLFVAEEETGLCRVICFSPRHDLTLPEMDLPGIEAVLRTWSDQTAELGALNYIHYVQVFENKGAVMGCSNPHPHSQIWTTGHVPNEPARELVRQDTYLAEKGSCLLCDTVAAERAAGERVVAQNEHFTAVVPFWAVWPFEVLVAANFHAASLPDLNPAQIAGLADVLKQVTIQYDNLFEISFPYSMGFHQASFDGVDHPGQHLHAHFYPPLLRSATVRKFMVGFEMLGMPQRDLTPETAALRLRELSPVHYKSR